MKTADKTLLFISDDEALRSKLPLTLSGRIKELVVCGDGAAAIREMNKRHFDGFILRLRKPLLKDPQGAFHHALGDERLERTPWVVLGKDVEDEHVVVSHSQVKFLENPADDRALLRMLGGLFFSSAHDAVDENFVNPIVASVLNVLKTMGQTELTPKPHFLKKQGQGAPITGDISGMIAMNSTRFLGAMALCFEKGLALKIYENMLGSALTEINDDVKDAVSELTNIIFGNARRDLNATGHTIEPALPTVFTGPKHEISHSVRGECVCLPFESPYGRLVVECMISFKGSTGNSG